MEHLAAGAVENTIIGTNHGVEPMVWFGLQGCKLSASVLASGVFKPSMK